MVLSKDGVPVIFHDTHIDTTTDVAQKFPGRQRADGRFYALDFTWDELRSLRVSERFDPKTGAAQTTLKLGAPAYIAPAAYNGALYVLTDNGQLICIR